MLNKLKEPTPCQLSWDKQFTLFQNNDADRVTAVARILGQRI